MEVLFRTERLLVRAFSYDFLEDYYREFTDAVTKYQFPDSFRSLDAANEALRGLIGYLNARKKYRYYIYEVDVRNLPSVHLVEKFRFEKGGYEEAVTGSGKALKLQTYHILPE